MSDESAAVLIDTSVWVETLRHVAHPLKSRVDALAGDNRARICSAVAAELIQGSQSARDLKAVEELLGALPNLEADDSVWLEAGRLSRRLKAHGASVGLLDCYLASLALAHHCAMFSLDKHFLIIAKHSPLKLLPSE